MNSEADFMKTLKVGHTITCDDMIRLSMLAERMKRSEQQLAQLRRFHDGAIGCHR